MSPETTNQPTFEQQEERAALQINAAILYSERGILNTDYANCTSEASAVLMNLEQQCLFISEEFEWDKLRDSINPLHHEKIDRMWDNVVLKREDIEESKESLMDYWTNAPEIEDEIADTVIAKTPLQIQRHIKKGIKALGIDHNRFEKESDEYKTIKKWRSKERGARARLYISFRDYMTSLRAYFAALLEKNASTGETVLPTSNENRDRLVRANRIAEIIHIFHQVANAIKAICNKQPNRRMRKFEYVPFAAHLMRSATSGIRNDLHSILGDSDKETGLTSIILKLIHDAYEDTKKLSIQQVIDYIRDKLDHIDSTIIQDIVPCFEENYRKQAENMKDEEGEPLDEEEVEREIPGLHHRKRIKFMKTHRRQGLRQGLRIASNNVIMKDKEKKKAVRNSIAGKEKTTKLLGLTEMDLKRWGVSEAEISEEPTIKTFQQFDEETEYDEEKLAKFLLKLTTITDSGAIRRRNLSNKNEDRIDTMPTLHAFPPDKQFGILRSTTTRLIAYNVLDHDRENFPTNNSLLTLMRATLKEYNRAKKEYPELFEKAIDTTNIMFIKEWIQKIIPDEDPEEVKEGIRRYIAAKNTTQCIIHEDSQSQPPYPQP